MIILFNQKKIQMFSSAKTIFKKLLIKNAANFINDSDNFDNIDMKDKID